jgi:hypothetical protein
MHCTVSTTLNIGLPPAYFLDAQRFRSVFFLNNCVTPMTTARASRLTNSPATGWLGRVTKSHAFATTQASKRINTKIPKYGLLFNTKLLRLRSGLPRATIRQRQKFRRLRQRHHAAKSSIFRRCLCSAERALLRADSLPALPLSCRYQPGGSLPSRLGPAFG